MEAMFPILQKCSQVKSVYTGTVFAKKAFAKTPESTESKIPIFIFGVSEIFCVKSVDGIICHEMTNENDLLLNTFTNYKLPTGVPTVHIFGLLLIHGL
jgi:hypothetical protein